MTTVVTDLGHDSVIDTDLTHERVTREGTPSDQPCERACSIGVLLAVLLNFLLPHEREEPVHELDVSKAGPDFEYGQKGGPEYADTTLPAPPATNYADGPKPTEAMLRASDPRYVDGPVVQMHPVV